MYRRVPLPNKQQERIMKRRNITVRTYEGSKKVAAYVSEAFPGIAVHRNLRTSDKWTATHIESGKGISCSFPLRRHASTFSALAAKTIDFTKSGKEVEETVSKDRKLLIELTVLADRFS